MVLFLIYDNIFDLFYYFEILLYRVFVLLLEENRNNNNKNTFQTREERSSPASMLMPFYPEVITEAWLLKGQIPAEVHSEVSDFPQSEDWVRRLLVHF